MRDAVFLFLYVGSIAVALGCLALLAWAARSGKIWSILVIGPVHKIAKRSESPFDFWISALFYVLLLGIALFVFWTMVTGRAVLV